MTNKTIIINSYLGALFITIVGGCATMAILHVSQQTTFANSDMVVPTGFTAESVQN